MEMDRRTQWSGLVDKDGNVFEWEDKHGCDFLLALPKVLEYASHFLQTEYPALGCYFSAQSGWLRLAFSRHQHYALIIAEQVTLPFELSEREFQILSLVGHGLSNSEIAECLFISDRTVAKHLEHIFVKTAIENRTLLALFALQHQLHYVPTPACLTQSPLPVFALEHPQQAAEKPQNFALNTRKARPITIGVPFVEQGLGQIDSKELLNGTQLAVEALNQQGGIQGREIQIVSAGYRVEEKDSILRAYHCLFEQEVDAISTNYACYLPEIHELVATQSIPYLHDASHSGSDKSGKIGNIFQVCAGSVNYGLGVVRFLEWYQHTYPKQMKRRRVVLVTVKWQLIDIGLESFIASLNKLHWQVELIVLEKSAQAFEQAMQRLHQLEPTLIVFASYFTEDILAFYHAFILQPLNAIIYAIYSPSTLQPSQQSCEGVLWATTTGLPSTYAAKCFNQRYQQRFGEMPSFSQASLAFDQVNILANVWKVVDFPRQFKQVNQGIRTLVNHGVNGSYFLGNEHQIGLTYPDNTQDLSISQPHLLYQIQRGKNTIIAPSLFAEAGFQLPAWFVS